MTRWERWTFNAFHGVVAVTGVVYFYMKYFVTPTDPFSIANHPWQPMMRSTHLLAAPVFIAFFGILFRSHSLRKILSRDLRNRRSGWTSVVSFSLRALSGYFVQVASSPSWVTASIWLQVATSLVFVVGYGVHLGIGWRLTSPSALRSLGRTVGQPS